MRRLLSKLMPSWTGRCTRATKLYPSPEFNGAFHPLPGPPGVLEEEEDDVLKLLEVLRQYFRYSNTTLARLEGFL